MELFFILVLSVIALVLCHFHEKNERRISQLERAAKELNHDFDIEEDSA